MTFDPNKPVSLEEYNATVSSGYVKTYEHMKNDPTLTQEEFIQQASTMSEKYHEALQEFQEAQDVQNGTNMNTNEGVHNSSQSLDGETVSNVEAGTIETEAVDDGANTGGVDNDNGMDNEGDGLDDGMDI